ncbi:hypothetical protein N7523_003730 [Penicillium sp. IBT 18751x]|nr:hypothetical protein N7523_003730 [Penicillium sp. IBT 18751x]
MCETEMLFANIPRPEDWPHVEGGDLAEYRDHLRSRRFSTTPAFNPRTECMTREPQYCRVPWCSGQKTGSLGSSRTEEMSPGSVLSDKLIVGKIEYCAGRPSRHADYSMNHG